MSTTEPIRNRLKLKEFRNYYRYTEPHRRNYLLIVTGLNTALRISDILALRWGDIYDVKKKRARGHIRLRERKTGKAQEIAINKSLRDAIKAVLAGRPLPDSGDYIFRGYGTGPMHRTTAYRIIKRAADAVGLTGTISCHSLRKTFGYHAWKHGAQPALLMNIYNHSSFQITRRYLGIDQDDKDGIFLENNL